MELGIFSPQGAGDAESQDIQKVFCGRKTHQGLRNESGRPWLRELQAADPWRVRDGARRHPHVSVLLLHPPKALGFWSDVLGCLHLLH